MLTLGIILWSVFFSAFAQEEPTTRPHVLAIGDLHADLSAARATFKLAGIIDENDRWIAKNTIVVQTGDITDRGPDGRTMLEWVKSLETQAKGKFIVLLGNHEIMNLMGDWRYVSSADIDSFGGQEQRISAFQPGGDWQRWLLEHEIVAQVDDTIFVHGGIHPDFSPIGVDGINKLAKEAIANGLTRAPLLNEKGPLWYRDYITEPESLICPILIQALTELKATRMVVGHTTQRNGTIKTRCKGKIFAIDTGISSHYGGHSSYLKIDGQTVTAVYPSHSQVLVGKE